MRPPPGAWSRWAIGQLSARVVASRLPLRCHRAQSEWTVEHRHLQTEYGDSVEAVDDDLLVVQERFDDLGGDVVVRWLVYFVVRVSVGGPHDGIASPGRERCGGLELGRVSLISREGRMRIGG